MSNYTQSTNFATKDALTSGDPLKIVKGTEINTEFVNISVAIATKLDSASGTISGATINSSTIGATTPSTGAFTTLSASGTTTLSGVTTINDAQRPVIDNIKLGYATTATAAGTTTLTVASPHQQFFTGSTTQTIVLPVTSTLALGLGYTITNNSSGVLTVQSSGLNDIVSVPAKATVKVVCILISGTTAASWSYVFEGSSNIPFSELNSISASIAANALTVTLNPCTIDFRSSTLTSGATLTRSVPTAITLTVSSGSTLGTTSAVESRLAILAIDNAGTVELAVINSLVYGPFDQRLLISTTAEGGAGGADSGSVYYSTTARTSVAFRVVGYITSTQATAGTWATTPSNVSGNGESFIASGPSQFQYDLYTSGATTWTAPAGVTRVKVICIAGGGGGGNHDSSVPQNGGNGGYGGIAVGIYTVTSGTGYVATVGAGGAGTNTSATNGSAGASSSFGSLLSATGGSGGISGNTTGFNGANGIGTNGVTGNSSVVNGAGGSFVGSLIRANGSSATAAETWTAALNRVPGSVGAGGTTAVDASGGTGGVIYIEYIG
jgi:hypothetical protein